MASAPSPDTTPVRVTSDARVPSTPTEVAVGAPCPRPSGRAVAVSVAAVTACLVVTVLQGNGPSEVAAGWLYPTLMAVSTVVVAVRGYVVRAERAAWWLVAAGLALPAVRWIVYPVYGALPTWRPLWLCFYPLVAAGILLLFRQRMKEFPSTMAIDAVIFGTTVSAAAVLAFDPFRSATGRSPLHVVLGLGFPAGDLLLAVGAAGALATVGWRGEYRWTFLVVAFLCNAVADVAVLVQVANQTYVHGRGIDGLRPCAAVLVALASSTPAGTRPPWLHATGRRSALPSLMCAAVLGGLLVYGCVVPLPRAAVFLAAAGLLAVVFRFGMSFGEIARLAESHRQAMTDDLTLLGNRRALSAALTAASLDHAATEDEHVAGPALLLLDLDRFKEVNDALGHHVGDEVLCHVARRLTECVGTAGLLTRIGGDEFAALLPAGTRPSDAEGLAARIVATCDEPVVLDDTTIQVAASVGIALCPRHCTHPADLLRYADAAMYRAKKSPQRFAQYDRARDSSPIGDRKLIGELQVALDAREVTCFYQPKINAADGSLHSVEALIRWPHPTRGLLTPNQFLPQAEAANLMRAVAIATLDTALGQSKLWRARGMPITVAVNLSTTNLFDVELVSHVGDLLARHGIPAESLILEITEGVSTTDESGRAHRVIGELRRLGVKLAIDDFGTGWSSLARLHDIDVDEIKLDGMFVRRVTSDRRATAIVRSTVALAHTLGAQLVAECVEDEDTLQAVREYGCDITQGFLHCRPLPGDELERWLLENENLTPVASHT